MKSITDTLLQHATSPKHPHHRPPQHTPVFQQANEDARKLISFLLHLTRTGFLRKKKLQYLQP